eukprot:1125464_1
MAQLHHNNIVRYYASWIEPVITTNKPSNEELSLLLSSDATKWTDDIYNYWQNKMSYSCLFLQSEYCGDYTLKDFINDRKRMTPDRDDNMYLFAQILLGLAHCHSHQIIHRDLKPENIFLMSKNDTTCTQQLTCKIGDFGLSTV